MAPCLKVILPDTGLIKLDELVFGILIIFNSLQIAAYAGIMLESEITEHGTLQMEGGVTI